MNKILNWIFLFLIAHSGYSQSKEKYDAIVDSLDRTGQTDQIIPYFEQELTKYPGNETILRWLGLACLAQNQFDKGEKYYRQAIKTNPKCGTCYMQLGRMYFMLNEAGTSNEYMKIAAEAEPENPTIFSVRAQMKEQQGDRIGARFDHNKAIQLSPEDPQLYIDRGDFNARQKSYSLALNDYAEAAHLVPESYLPHYKRADAYYYNGQAQEALGEIEWAIALDSTRYELYTGRGAIYAFMGAHQNSIDDYSKSLAMNPNTALTYYNRALSYYSLEDMDAYCSDMNNAYTLMKFDGADEEKTAEVKSYLNIYCDNSTASFYYQRGVAYYNQGKFDKAVNTYTAGIEKYNENSLLYSFRGNANFILGNFDSSIKDHYKAIELKENARADFELNSSHAGADPDSLNMYMMNYEATMRKDIAESKMALGLYEEALTEINQAIVWQEKSKMSDQTLYYSTRGEIYLAQGKFKEAITDFTKCKEINPNYSPAYSHLALIQLVQAKKIKIKLGSLMSTVNNLYLGDSWNLSVKKPSKKMHKAYDSILKDCNKAIELNAKDPLPYFVRGYVKRLMMDAGYCVDFEAAKSLGHPIALQLLMGCKTP
jgi:tetratricopeptide (TPR) repeat protein